MPATGAVVVTAGLTNSGLITPPAIGLVTNLGVGMGEPPDWMPPLVEGEAWMGAEAMGMKTLCREPTVLGDCITTRGEELELPPLPPVGGVVGEKMGVPDAERVEVVPP